MSDLVTDYRPPPLDVVDDRPRLHVEVVVDAPAAEAAGLSNAGELAGWLERAVTGELRDAATRRGIPLVEARAAVAVRFTDDRGRLIHFRDGEGGTVLD